MKRLNKILFACSLLLLGFMTSCEQENLGTKYENVEGMTFVNSVLNTVTVDPNRTSLKIDLLRSDASASLNGTVQHSAVLLKDTTEYTEYTVSDYSFEAGATRTTITIDAAPLYIGGEILITLSIPKELASIDGITTTKIKVKKDYNWQPLGQGTYVDNFASGVGYPVEIVKAEGFDRYRALKPYVETMKNDDGGNTTWVATSSAPYVEFWTTTDNLVNFAPFFIGLNYQANSKQPIYAYHPSLFQNVGVSFNKWLDAKTVQLAPMFYIPAIGGGWNYTQKDGVIIITLP